MTIPTLTTGSTFRSTLRSMRLSTFRSILAPVLFAGLAVLTAGVLPAAAATRTWSGAGGNNQWTTPANWQGGVAPVAGDDLVFPVGGAQTVNVNNYPAGTSFGSITFVAAYSIGGNVIALTGALAVTSAASPTITVGIPIAIASAPDLIVNVVSATATLELGGPLSGAAGLTKIGAGTLRMIGTVSNTYTGLTSVNEGTLALGRMQPAISVPAGVIVGNTNGGLLADVVRLETPEQIAGPITVTPSGLLDFGNQNQTVTTTLTLLGGRITTGTGTLALHANIHMPDNAGGSTIEGQLSLGGATRTLDITDGPIPALDIKAVIADGGAAAGLIKTGSAWMRLSGANTYTGLTTIQNGILVVTNPQALGTPAAGTVIEVDATLVVETNLPAEPIVANGDGTGNVIYCDKAGNFSIGGPVALSGQPDMVGGFGCHLVFDGPLTGAPSRLQFATFAPASFTLNAVNTFTGITSIVGDVRLGVNDALAASSIVSATSGVLDFQNHPQTMKYLTGSADVLLGTATLTIDAPQNALGFDGVLSGTGGVVKKGVGTWYLSDANTYTGPTLVQGGFLSVSGSIVSAVTLDGGTLQGRGVVGTIGGSSGTLEPTYVGNPAKLTSSSVTLTSGITFHALVNGPGAGTQYSQLAVNGTIDLGGATLDADVNSNFLAANVELILIDNDGTDAVVGTFQSLPEGSIIQSGGKAFRLSYAGGTGNDVTMMATESTYYLSEGATGSFFDTDILIANPNGDEVPISIEFLKEDGTTIAQSSTLSGASRITLRADDITGLEAAAFSTVVKSLSGLPIVVERTMRWDASGYGAHTDKATGGAAYKWYFAEGSQGFFWTYLLLTNPNANPNEAKVTFLRENLPPLERTYALAPTSRSTIDIGNDAELMNTSFGIEVTFDNPGTAERAMYFGDSPLWKGGHESAGETVTSSNWFLAEGATGTFFETFILIANTHNEAIEATLTFLPASGVPVEKKKMVPARGRITVNVELEDPSLADGAVATQVTSFMPKLIVERAQYWPFTPDQWNESHNSFGVTAPGTHWGLAEGRVGGPENYQTFLLLANPGMTDAEATVLFLRENGTPFSKKITVPAQTRVNLSVGGDVPELSNERFGASITSDHPIVVERAMFWDANGQFWSAGTNATATRLP